MAKDGDIPTRLRRHLRLGRLAPVVLIAWAGIDLGSRWLPPEWFGITPLSVALRRPPHHASFAPNFSQTAHRPFGAAVREANLPATERRAPEHYSTDRLGFRRNPYVPEDEAADVLVLRGFSYVYGAGLSDEQTLPAMLTRLTGSRVYNGGRWHMDDIEDLQALDWLLEQLPVRPRTAIVVYLEHEDPPFYIPGGTSRVLRLAGHVHASLVEPAARLRAAYHRARRVERAVVRWWDFSPLEVVTTRVHRAMSNDRLLPNVYRNGSHQLLLPDGRRMVFRDFETRPVRFPRDSRAAAQTAEYLEWWHTQLGARGIEAVVLLLPTRYTVYAPFLETGALQRQSAAAVRYLEHLQAELTWRGIRSVDATPIFHRLVRDELRQGELSFYREDNHWTPRGVEHVARELVHEMPDVFVPDESAGGTPPEDRPAGETRRVAAAIGAEG